MRIVDILRQLLPFQRALTLMDQLLAIVIDPVTRGGDQPAMATHPANKMLTGAVQNVMGRLMPRHVLRACAG
ncbi:hypothetical protein D3C81_1009180 [compost metagenome]